MAGAAARAAALVSSSSCSSSPRSAWAIVDIHSLHRPVGSPPNAAYKTVHFTASDGVRLEGWHRPSRNGASVLMISGGGGNRRSTLRHARMLERHGYGVLVYDPRGSGNSEGTVNSYGWGWDKDVDAAIDFLAAHGERAGSARSASRPAPTSRSTPPAAARDVARRRRRRLRRDRLRGHQGVHPRPARLRADVAHVQDASRSSRAARAPRSRSPTGSSTRARRNLLISANKAEKQWGELYDRRGGSRSTLWYLPHAGHTAALRQYPAAYERRVTAFLDAHLLT